VRCRRVTLNPDQVRSMEFLRELFIGPIYRDLMAILAIPCVGSFLGYRRARDLSTSRAHRRRSRKTSASRLAEPVPRKSKRAISRSVRDLERDLDIVARALCHARYRRSRSTRARREKKWIIKAGIIMLSGRATAHATGRRQKKEKKKTIRARHTARRYLSLTDIN
jgi:hypothetical protein